MHFGYDAEFGAYTPRLRAVAAGSHGRDATLFIRRDEVEPPGRLWIGFEALGGKPLSDREFYRRHLGAAADDLLAQTLTPARAGWRMAGSVEQSRKGGPKKAENLFERKQFRCIYK